MLIMSESGKWYELYSYALLQYHKALLTGGDTHPCHLCRGLRPNDCAETKQTWIPEHLITDVCSFTNYMTSLHCSNRVITPPPQLSQSC